jgi:hypothetical protein
MLQAALLELGSPYIAVPARSSSAVCQKLPSGTNLTCFHSHCYPLIEYFFKTSVSASLASKSLVSGALFNLFLIIDGHIS